MEQMQRNTQPMDMGKMQEAMACMKDIDQSALKGLEEEGEKMNAEVEAMCRTGNRDAAQEKAMEYAKEMMNRPELKKMRECSKMMAGMMPKMPFENLEEESNNRHICDEFNPVDGTGRFK
ncbi:MAG: hypothetical protein WD425_12670 [Nitrospirales bacterium]